MGFPVSGCGTRGFAAQTVLARDDTEKPHLLPTAPAIVRPTNTPPLVVADLRSGFDNDLFFFSDRFELATLELFIEVSHSLNFLEFRSSGVAGVQTTVRIHLFKFNGSSQW